MDDLISRSALLEAFGEPPNAVDPLDRVWLQQFGDWLEYTDKVKAAPAVDAETVIKSLPYVKEALEMAKQNLVPVRHGRWELVTTKYVAAQYVRVGYCQNCNEERPVDNYCPNCGAKMDGE